MMKLIYICLLSVCSMNSNSLSTYAPEYFDMYKSSIEKVIKKKLKLKDFQIIFESTIENKNSFLEHFEIHDLENERVFSMYCGPVVTCDLGGCTASKFVKDNSSSKEYFDILIILDEEANIEQLKILNYVSDFGYEITSKSYLKKFNNHHICEFNLTASKVDAISGATISSDAIISTLDELCLSL